MGCNTFHLVDSDIGCYAIRQGVALGESLSGGGFNFYIKDTDLTGKKAIGQIRKTVKDQLGNNLADLVFSSPVYGSYTVNGITFNASLIRMSLSASITYALPITKEQLPLNLKISQIDKLAIPGKNCWLYDARIIDMSDPTFGLSLVDLSYVQVIGTTTEN